MANGVPSKARLYSYDQSGETLTSREVDFWFIRDGGKDEDQRGIYISLAHGGIGAGITMLEVDLAREGYFRLDRLDEDALHELGYVKLF